MPEPEHTARIHDGRVVTIEDLPGHCTSYTPAGRVAIRCHSAEIHYDIPTGELGSVFVRGTLIHEADVRRRAASLRSGSAGDRDYAARRFIERSYRVDWRATPRTVDAPPWLVDLIEQYRPAVLAGSR